MATNDQRVDTPSVRDQRRRAAFARELRRVRLEKGWNQSELARAASKFMKGKEFGRDSVSKYESGMTLPLPLNLNALAKALGKAPTDLLPDADPLANVGFDTPLALTTHPDGTAQLIVNQRLPLADAMQIMQILGKHNNVAS